MENLELALKYAVMFEERSEKSCYNAFWLEGYIDEKSTASKNTEETLYQYLIAKTAEEPFSVLHGTNKYEDFAQRVRLKIE